MTSLRLRFPDVAMLNYLFCGLLIFIAPFLLLMLAGLPSTWLYLIPLTVVVAGTIIVEAGKPPRTR